MRKIIFFIIASAAFAQGPKIPVTAGGTPPYVAVFASTGTGTILGTTHLQGIRPVVETCYTISGSTKTPFTDYTVGAINSLGDFAITWTGSRTGECLVSSGKGGVGAAGTSPTVAVGTTTTASPGTPAAVNETVVGANHTFAFTIPAGQPGTDGIDGVDGSNGSNGAGAATRTFTFTAQVSRTITYSAGNYSDVGGTHDLTCPCTVTAVDSAGIPRATYPDLSGSPTIVANMGAAFTGTVAIHGAGSTTGGGGDMLAANNLSDLNNASLARANLGVAIGVDVMAYSAALATLGGKTVLGNGANIRLSTGSPATNDCAKFDANGNIVSAGAACGAGGSGAWGSITGTLSSQTDLNTALGLKAPLASPTFTGTPTIPSFASATHTHTNAAGGGQITDAALSAAVTRAKGGLNSTSAGTGILRDGTTPTASELSGDATTSGSNVVTVVKINGVTISGTPSNGQVPIASSGSAAAWGTPSGSGNMSITSGSSDPSGACTAGAHYLQTVNLDEWFCPTSGTWKRFLAAATSGTWVATGTTGTAPSTPTTGDLSCYYDSTSKTQICKDDAGATSTTVRADTGATNNFVTGISAAGVISKAQPSFSNISGSVTDAQVPNSITVDLATAATALAANGANCSAGQFPLGVDASGAVETCTALPTTIAGTSNEITASASTGPVTISLASTVNLASKVLRIPSSTSLPGTCSTGDIYMDTDATSGQRLYLCQSANTWVVQGDGSGGGGGCNAVSASGDAVAVGNMNPWAASAYSDDTQARPLVNTGTANYTILRRVFMPCSFTPDKFAFYITTAGAAGCRLNIGLYDSTKALVLHSGVLTDATTVECDSTGAKVLTSGTSPAAVGVGSTFASGNYWIAATSNDTAIRVQGMSLSGTPMDLFNAVSPTIGYLNGAQIATNGALNSSFTTGSGWNTAFAEQIPLIIVGK
jgi:hypothetical protein